MSERAPLAGPRSTPNPKTLVAQNQGSGADRARGLHGEVGEPTVALVALLRGDCLISSLGPKLQIFVVAQPLRPEIKFHIVLCSLDDS